MGQCPHYEHMRASSFFFLKKTIELSYVIKIALQNFLPDLTANGDLLFTFSRLIILDFQSLSSDLQFCSQHKDFSCFCR